MHICLSTFVDVYQAALMRHGMSADCTIFMPLHFGVVEHSCRAE